MNVTVVGNVIVVHYWFPRHRATKAQIKALFQTHYPTIGGVCVCGKTHFGGPTRSKKAVEAK